ncbi:hypothetical protein ACRRTK_002282 [Alexandromys fortis]
MPPKDDKKKKGTKKSAKKDKDPVNKSVQWQGQKEEVVQRQSSEQAQQSSPVSLTRLHTTNSYPKIKHLVQMKATKIKRKKILLSMCTELPKQRHSNERVKTDFTGAPGDLKLSDLQQACKLLCLDTQCMHKSCGASLSQALSSSSDNSGALPPATTAANRPPPGYVAGIKQESDEGNQREDSKILIPTLVGPKAKAFCLEFPETLRISIRDFLRRNANITDRLTATLFLVLVPQAHLNRQPVAMISLTQPRAKQVTVG